MNKLFTLYKFNDSLELAYGYDSFSILFMAVTGVLFAACTIYSLSYMKEKEHKARYYTFLALTFLAMCGMSFGANFFTFYLNYELLTLCSAPLVMHDQTKEALSAGLKYLLYSFGGAYFVLFGFFVLNAQAPGLSFSDTQIISGDSKLVVAAVFCIILGFGVKAGMWPCHAWLTSAHPVAVSPASALLSGAVVNAGVAGVVRTLAYLSGSHILKGTGVRTVWEILTLATILMGSLLAFFEPVFKRRLAYSTISQLSYILFGLALLSADGYTGSMIQLCAHAFAKCGLFLVAGILIKATGCIRVDDMRGVGLKHPFIMACYTLCALSMVGIPPTGGFTAKWFLLKAAFTDASPFIRWFGPLSLMLSALLTAGYLFTISMRAYFPGEDFEYNKSDCRIGPGYAVPIAIVTLLSLVTGLFPSLFINM